MTGAELADEIERLFEASRSAHEAYAASKGDSNAAALADESWKTLTKAMVRHKSAILAALRAERPEPAAGDVEAVAIEDDCEPFDPANPKLKPCPFCGAEAELVEIDDMTDADCGGNFVACKACEASTNLRFSAGDDARPLVCEQWNRRAALAQGQTGDER